MKRKFFRQMLASILAVALLVTGMSVMKTQETKAATTLGS